MRIYADFNGVEECEAEPQMLRLNLTGYGTLASLSALKMKLKEDQLIEFSDSEGTAALGRTYFDPSRVSNNCSGWFAKFCQSEIHQVEPLEQDNNGHLCFNCGRELESHFAKSGRNYNEVCPFCDCPIMIVMAPPV